MQDGLQCQNHAEIKKRALRAAQQAFAGDAQILPRKIIIIFCFATVLLAVALICFKGYAG